MEFVSWHYSLGLKFYIKSWREYLVSIYDYFSLGLLVKTIFSPWKRLMLVDDTPGFNLSLYLENKLFNFVSRFIGAFVRVSLIIIGVFALAIGFIAGLSGFLIWLVFPILGYPVYSKIQKQPHVLVGELYKRLRKADSLALLFESDPGKFVLEHLDKKYDEITSAISPNIKLPHTSPDGLSDLFTKFVEHGIFNEDKLREMDLSPEDFLNSAYWWDLRQWEKTKIASNIKFNVGLGRELSYGYTPELGKYATDLSKPTSFSHRLIGREEVVNRMERVLNGGSNIFLLGEPGVGKKTVVLEFAYRAITGQFGQQMSFKKIYEFDFNAALSSKKDINEKKNTFKSILKEAEYAGNIILMIKNIHLLTNTSIEGMDFTDVFEDVLEKRKLKIIAVMTPIEYERFVSGNSRLRKYFEVVEVKQPDKEIAMKILIEFANRVEIDESVVVQMPALRQIIDQSDRYITDTPFPEKALELLESVLLEIRQNGGKTITAGHVDKVISEKTGVSFESLAEVQKEKLVNLEEIIHERLVNQEAAVSMISKIIRSKSLKVVDTDKPIGSFLFLGPTGVGKTETAKVLAKTYFGSDKEIIRFDMAEYAGDEGFARLIGSPQRQFPGELTTAIRKKPAGLLLLDEIEKAPREVMNLLLRLLDEGVMTDAFGKSVKGSNLFIICTSNAGAEFIRQSIQQDLGPDELQKTVIDHVLKEGIFSPEFVNRFDGAVVYEPLKDTHLREIARLIISDFAESLKKQSIYLEITEELVQKLSQDGYEQEFGARPMHRIVNVVLGDVVSKAILGKEVHKGDKIKIVPKQGKNEYFVEKVQK